MGGNLNPSTADPLHRRVPAYILFLSLTIYLLLHFHRFKLFKVPKVIDDFKIVDSSAAV